MPAAPKGAPPSPPETTTADARAESAGASPVAEPAAASGRLDPGVYQYTAPFTTVYDVPLTARPADGSNPATVFDWAEGAPADGRWSATRSKPNQVPDNCVPPATPTEV